VLTLPREGNGGGGQECERLIAECSYSFDSEVWSGVSDAAKSFVTALLQAEPHQRCVGSARLLVAPPARCMRHSARNSAAEFGRCCQPFRRPPPSA
jgi:hypothetical protein